MRIRMVVLHLLSLLRASHTRMAQPTRFTFQRSAVVRMTNLCDGISKRFRCSVLHRPANWFRSHSQQISSPLVPPSTAFSFLHFHLKLYRSLPKSQLPLTTHFCPTPPTVEATHRFPHSAVHSIMAQRQLPKFLQGFPPIASSNRLISLYPARVNFCARQSLRFVNTQLIKTAEHTPVHSSRPQCTKNDSQLRENLPQTTRPAATKSQTSTNQHTKRVARAFQITSASARNHLERSVQQKITWVKRSQHAHSKVQARSSRKTTMSTRVRDSGTV